MMNKRDLRRVSERLQKLHDEHPLRFNLLALAFALVIFGLAMLVKFILSGAN
jgi:hypothetical protein